MFLSEELIHTLEVHISDISKGDYRVQFAKPVSGGSINNAYRLHTASHEYFVKVNGEHDALTMFQAESNGLNLLRKHAPESRIPQTYAYGRVKGESFLLMEWIEQGRKSRPSMEKLGLAIAGLHHSSDSSFGLDHDNYLGSLPQSNKQHDNWADFFIHERLEKQLAITKERGLGDHRLYRQFEELYKRLPDLFPKESPALLHGDLWGGNYLIDTNGAPVLIDPATYYGHREADMAMTMLFGGFDHSFYEAYHEAFPLKTGWRERIDLWNLYPLLFHLNVFGTSYLGQIRSCLNAYI